MSNVLEDEVREPTLDIEFWPRLNAKDKWSEIRGCSNEI